MNLSLFRLPALAVLLAFLTVALSGCDLAKGIFKAGFFSALILVVLLVVVALMLFRRLRR